MDHARIVYKQRWDDGNTEFIVIPRNRSRSEDHVIVFIMKQEVCGHRAEDAKTQQQVCTRDTNCGDLENVPLAVLTKSCTLQARVGLRLYLCLKHSMMVALQPPFSRSLDLVV